MKATLDAVDKNFPKNFFNASKSTWEVDFFKSLEAPFIWKFYRILKDPGRILNVDLKKKVNKGIQMGLKSRLVLNCCSKTTGPPWPRFFKVLRVISNKAF